MKKLFFLIILILTILLAKPSLAQEKPLNLYLFWGDGCPHCADEKVFLKEIEDDYPQLNIVEYEIWYNQDNAKLLQEISGKMGFTISGIPLTIIGEETITGFFNEKTTGKQIKEQIEKCLESGCSDPVADIVNRVQTAPAPGSSPEKAEPDEKYLITLPLVGEINAKEFSLPVLTIIIAGLDGFNPCAMWVLLFLITLLLGMKNKKRMWILGSAFIIASGFIYFLFLTAWLNLFIFISFIIWVRIAIGIVAIASGIYYLREFIRNKTECKVIVGERKDKMMTNLKFVTKLPSFWLALIGIIMIAFAVNLIELVCSIGLPAIYTNVLAVANLPAWQYYLLLILYIIIFMLDDMIVFVAAMLTLQTSGLSHKYGRYVNLIGGIAILILGILLILKPQWLMFG